MKVVTGAFRFPGERDRRPVVVAMLLQAFALLALIIVVRDRRPPPKVDSAEWERMGIFVEFTSIFPMAAVFAVFAIVSFYILDPAVSGAARATQCVLLLKLFAIAIALVDAQLVYYGLWKGIWEMFGAMAAIASLDLFLVFIVLRYLHLEHSDHVAGHGVAPPPRGR